MVVLWAATATRFSPWFEGLYFKEALQRVLWSALTRQQHACKFKFELRNLDLQVQAKPQGLQNTCSSLGNYSGLGLRDCMVCRPLSLQTAPFAPKFCCHRCRLERERVMLLGWIG